MSLPRIIEQIAKLDAKVLQLQERGRLASDNGSREFFRVQLGHFETLRADLRAMRITLEDIDARAKTISGE